MEGKKKIGFSYAVLVIILFATVCFLTDYILIDRKLNENKGSVNNTSTSENTNNNGSTNNTGVERQTITQEELMNTVFDEFDYEGNSQLHVLYGKTNLSQITNQQKLSLAFQFLKDNFNKNDEDVKSSFTKEELDDAFSKTIISKLGLTHEDIIAVKSVTDDGNLGFGYTYNDGVYDNQISTNSGIAHISALGKKILSFSENDGKYTLSVKYLWSELGETLFDNHKFYGKYNDSLNGQNELGDLPVEVFTGDQEDVDKWFEENFDSFKDELETYNYVFVKENNKISLVDFYVD